MAVTTTYVLLLVAALLVGVALVAGQYSARVGVSHLVVFLGAGMLAGVDGPLGIHFDSFGLSFALGNLALAVILLDGGLRTSSATFRLGVVPASLLASLGVAVTAAITAVAVQVVLGIGWLPSLLLGTVVSSTDAAAVFGQLRRSRVGLPPRLAATVEIESGLNDPVAVFLMLSCIELILRPEAGWPELAWLLLRQAAIGLALGVLGARAMGALARRLRLGEHDGGLAALLLTAGAVALFALAGLVEGSGFLAAYVFGVVLARRGEPVVELALGGIDGYAWLAQSAMFLLLGLLVTPHEMLRFALPALAVAAVLMFVARPAAVALCLAPLGFSSREQVFVAWAGLRGAVPIILALFPVLQGVPNAYRFFDVAFVVVLVSLLVQGPTIGWMARVLGLQPSAVSDALPVVQAGHAQMPPIPPVPPAPPVPSSSPLPPVT
jgi:cell volume regulation protein A